MAEDARLVTAADELYGLGPGEFTARRDELVREHRADKEHAAALKALRRPTVAAWVVNLLVRREPEQVDQLLAVGAALREAQASLDAAQLREFTKQRRQLTASVTTLARRTAREEGQRVTEAVALQVEETLTAAMLDADAAAAVRSGLLVAPVRATGVDAVDVVPALALPGALGFSATPREQEPPSRPDLHVVPDPDADEKARREADEALAAARAELEAAQRQADEAAVEVGELEARTLELQARLDEMRREVAEVESELEAVDADLEDAEDAQGLAAEAVREAEAGLTRAQSVRDRLGR
ncbi:MAG: hypothetical protein ACI379_07185 [Nocardioides sp.]|uniref:hypothetical protein n=1 Tax=Nocardioides sp. TaxID=35761 RepID=UPI003F11D315